MRRRRPSSAHGRRCPRESGSYSSAARAPPPNPNPNPNPIPIPNPIPSPNPNLTQRPPALVRKLVRVACDLPNAVLHLQWSADSTELSAVDEAGYVRVWSIIGEAAATYGLASGRSNIFWQQVRQL